MNIKSKNNKPKKQKLISFTYDDGYEAYEWLQAQSNSTRGGASGYIVDLLLKDKKKKMQDQKKK